MPRGPEARGEIQQTPYLSWPPLGALPPPGVFLDILKSSPIRLEGKTRRSPPSADPEEGSIDQVNDEQPMGKTR